MNAVKKESPFVVFGNCLKGKAYEPDGGFVSFLFCRYLGNSVNMINYANFINCYHSVLSDESQFKMVQSIKNKPGFIRWIKTTKPDIPEVLNEISNKYKISTKKAKLYNEILTKLENQKMKG